MKCQSHQSQAETTWLLARQLIAAFLIATLNGCQSGPQLRDAAATTLIDTAGTPRQPIQCGDSTASTLIFITTDCPIANGYAPEINRMVSSYSSQGITFCLVHVDPEVTLEQARKHAADFGYTCPVVIDPTHQLVKAVGATVTPEAAVITPNLELAYLGRIDDKHVDFGKKRAEPSQRDLQNALEAIVTGKPIQVARTKAIGCFMPDAAPDVEQSDR